MKSKAGMVLTRLKIFLVLLVAISLSTNLPITTPVVAQQILPYKNPKMSIDERVRDLLSRMTIEEKVAQMMCLWMEKPNDNNGVLKELLPFGGNFSPELAKRRMPYGIGQFARQREERDPAGS